MFARILCWIRTCNQPLELEIIEWNVELSSVCPFNYKSIYDNIMFQ